MAFETSAINSPYFNTFVAAQIHASDRALFSNTTKVSDLISVAGDVHHIFPKEYLKLNGIADKSKYNQVANFVYLDTQVNISIGKRSPSDYFSIVINQCDDGDMKIGTITNFDDYYTNLSINCIPDDIDRMTVNQFEDFLVKRRQLMAEKVQKYYQSI